MDESEYIKNIGLRIIAKREELGIKQTELAGLLGIDDSSLRRIESGRTNPTTKTLLKIAKALNTNIECFFVSELEYKLLVSFRKAKSGGQFSVLDSSKEYIFKKE